MNVLKFVVLFILCLMLPTGVLANTKPTEKPAMKPATKVKAEKAKPAVPAKKGAKKTKAPAKAKKKKPEGLVIGKKPQSRNAYGRSDQIARHPPHHQNQA